MIIFLIGPPNSGKSTQQRLLVENIPSARSIQPGSWLREQSNQDTPLGEFIAHNWNHEALSPLVMEYVDTAIEKVLRDTASPTTIIVDGYPRNAREASTLGRLCRGVPFTVVELKTSDRLVLDRAGERQRDNDDSDVSIAIRMESYTNNASKIRATLTSIDAAVYTIDSTVQRDPDDICHEIRQCKPQRVVIPPHSPQQHIVRTTFREAGATESATIIQTCLRLARSKRLYKQFFGTHPISLTRETLPRVRRFPYLVSLKITGERYMCYVSNEHLWLLSRSLRVFKGPHDRDLRQFDNTLVDGELVDDSYFVVLDCLVSNGRNCMYDPIMERLRKSVALGQFMFRGHALLFRPQEYVDRMQLPALLQRAANAPWKFDGIILQPARLPYRLGIDYNMFKWKPLGENSADFYFHAADSSLYCKSSPPTSTTQRTGTSATPIDTRNEPTIMVNNTKHVRFGRLLRTLQPEWLRDGMIIECVALPDTAIAKIRDDIVAEQWGSNELVWYPCMHRADKLVANIDWVAQSVIQSIIDNITQEELVKECSSPTITNTDLPPAALAVVQRSKKRHR